MKRINFKNKYSWIILLGCILLATIAMFAADWVVGRVQLEGYPNYVYGEHQQSEFGGCICGFHTEKIYDGTNKMPTNAVGEKVWTSTNDEWFDAYTFTYRYTTISSDNNKIQSADDGDETLYNILPAGTYTVRITEPATGQVICKNHPLTIMPSTYTVDFNFNNPKDLYLGEYPSLIVDYKIGNKVEYTYQAENAIEGAGVYQDTSVTKLFFDNYRHDLDDENIVYANGVSDPLFLNNYVIDKSQISENLRALADNIKYTAIATAHSTTTNLNYFVLKDAITATKKDGTVTALPSVEFRNVIYYAGHADSASSLTVPQGYTTQKFSHEIASDTTIESGVTFRIPNGVGDSQGSVHVKHYLPAEYPSHYSDAAKKRGYDYTIKHEAIGLSLIYQQYSDDSYPQTVLIHSNAYYRNDWRKNIVTVKAGTKLTNEGTIIIDAVVTGGSGGAPYSSIVFGDYAQITLEAEAEIINSESSSVINCYGFIAESYDNNGSQLLMDNGTLQVVFTIVEHRGGQLLMGVANPNVLELGFSIGREYTPKIDMSPMHRLYTQSVGAKMVVKSSASVNSFVDMYANESHNVTNIIFIGGNQSSMFQLADNNAYAEYKYIHSKTDSKRTQNIDVYGNAAFNTMKLKLPVSYSGLSITIVLDVSNTLFPLSHYYNISFNKADNSDSSTVTFTQSIKLLPGGSLTIGSGVVATIAKVAVYEDFDLLDISKLPVKGDNIVDNSGKTQINTSVNQGLNYPSDCEPGKLIVNGKLTIGSLAGKVYSAVDARGELIITTGTSFAVKELYGGYDNPIAVSSVKLPMQSPIYQYETLAANGAIWQNSTTQLSNAALSVGAYYSREGAWAKEQNITISYNSNGGSTIAPTAIKTNNRDGVTLKDLPMPTRDHYKFDAWYTNASLTNLANGTTVYTDTTLYAKWTPVAYTITLSYKYNGVSPLSEGIALPTTATYTIVDAHVSFPSLPGNLNIPSGYNFIGWYLDEECTNDINAISGKDLIDITGGNCTIYGLWANKAYKFNYNLNGVSELYDNGSVLSGETNYIGTTATLPDDTTEQIDASTNTEYKYYLSKWVYTASDATVYKFDPGTEISEIIAKESSDFDGVFNLIAEWNEKEYTLTVSGESSGNENISMNETVYLLESQIGDQFDTYHREVTRYDTDTNVNKCFLAWSHGKTSLSKDDFVDPSKSLTLTATWTNKYQLSAEGMSGGNKPIELDTNTYYLIESQIGQRFESYHSAATTYDNDITVNKYFAGWSHGKNTLSAADFDTETKSLKLIGAWESKLTVTITAQTGEAGAMAAGSDPTVKIQLSDGSKAIGTEYQTTTSGQFIYYFVNGQYAYIELVKGKSMSPTDISGKHNRITTDISIIAVGEDGCIAAGTLITLADGTLKKVEDLTIDDVLLVFNHETGRYESAGIIFIENDGYKYYNVINLEFSDGTTTKLIYEHALFDLTLNKYVYITESNCTEFIGHEFAVQSDSGFERVILTNAYVAEEYTGCYSLVTVYHLNYFIDGLFSIPGGIDGLFNIFEYGDDLVYDEEKMQADIDKYGLFTYEDFAEYLPKELYDAFPAPYLKVAIGKGMITFDDLLGYIEQFLVKNGLM